jgi:hypothetical protein
MACVVGRIMLGVGIVFGQRDHRGLRGGLAAGSVLIASEDQYAQGALVLLARRAACWWWPGAQFFHWKDQRVWWLAWG